MNTMKVFDVHFDNGPFDATHLLATDWLGHGNDQWFEHTVGDCEGYFPARDHEYRKAWLNIDEWLIDKDVEQGETVLIKHWW